MVIGQAFGFALIAGAARALGRRDSVTHFDAIAITPLD
jgi:hypothetical protein